MADGRWQEALPNERFDLLGGQRARAEEARLFARKVDNRRFDAQRCPSSVQDRVDAVAQIVQHVFGQGRTRATKKVGTGRGQR